MPKNKKPAPFMIFAMEYKKKDPNMTLECAISEAGNEWKDMTEEEKSHYKNRAKTDSTIINNNLRPREKYTSQGVPYSQLEKDKYDAELEERLIKKIIQDIIISGRNSNTLSSQTFYIIMANYFVRNIEGDLYYPAEIAICEYSLQDGITNKYHSFINPGSGLFGHAFEAIEHAKNTHNLPIPPNAMGEKNKTKLYSDILKFIQSKNCNKKDIPPVYTIDRCLPVLKSILNFLQDNSQLPDIKVFSLHYLFYYLKKTTSEIGDTKQVDSIHITNAILDRDYYEYQSGIACEFHENIDKTNYCALSYVIRWSYTFSDNMCMDLGITLIPGVHISSQADLTIINNEFLDTDFNDSESILSNNTWSTNYTQPKIEETFDNDKSMSITGERFPKPYNNNDRTNKKISDEINQKSKNDNRNYNESVIGIENMTIKDDDENPFKSRHKNIPREPSEDSFNFTFSSFGRGINLTKNDDSDFESNASVPIARGRGLLWNDTRSTSSNTSFGRGKRFE